MNLNRTRVLVPLFLVVSAASLPIATGATARAEAAPMCQGEPATIVGTDGADELVGTNGHDVIVGRGGDDRIAARGGDDLVCPGAGDDRIWAGRGADKVVSYSGGADVIGLGRGADDARTAGPEPVTVWAGPGRDRVTAAINQVEGLVLNGGSGRNRVNLVAWDFDHHLLVDRREGTLTGETVYAVVTHVQTYGLAGASGWTYRGVDKSDVVAADVAEGPVELFTFGGDDTLTGSAFDDLLDGGSGTDRAYPRGGDDTCVRIEVGCG